MLLIVANLEVIEWCVWVGFHKFLLKKPEELNMKYDKIALEADKETEEALRQMTYGSMGVFKKKMYEILYPIIFQDLIRRGLL